MPHLPIRIDNNAFSEIQFPFVEKTGDVICSPGEVVFSGTFEFIALPPSTWTRLEGVASTTMATATSFSNQSWGETTEEFAQCGEATADDYEIGFNDTCIAG